MSYACITSPVEVECFRNATGLPPWATSRLCPVCLGLNSAGEDGLITVSLEDPIVTTPCEACVKAALRLWRRLR